jgi:hypothetical protein
MWQMPLSIRRQAVFRVVGDFDRLVGTVDLDDARDRSERLLVVDAHLWCDAGQNRRLDDRALDLASGEHARALGLRVLEQAANPLDRRVVDYRTDRCALVAGIAEWE